MTLFLRKEVIRCEPRTMLAQECTAATCCGSTALVTAGRCEEITINIIDKLVSRSEYVYTPVWLAAFSHDRKGRESKIVFVAVCWLFDAAALRFFVPSTGADNTRHACTEEQNRQAGHIL